MRRIARGPVAYIEALLRRKMSYAAAMSLTAVTVFAGAIVAIAAGRENVASILVK